MNLKILFMILVYYSIIGLAFASSGSIFEDSGANYTNVLNSSDITSDELDEGGFFGTGITFTRWLGLITIGVGLPNDTPDWASTLYFAWSTLFLVFSIGFLVSSIWDG